MRRRLAAERCTSPSPAPLVALVAAGFVAFVCCPSRRFLTAGCYFSPCRCSFEGLLAASCYFSPASAAALANRPPCRRPGPACSTSCALRWRCCS